jgi:hypothetical protein
MHWIKRSVVPPTIRYRDAVHDVVSRSRV